MLQICTLLLSLFFILNYKYKAYKIKYKQQAPKKLEWCISLKKDIHDNILSKKCQRKINEEKVGACRVCQFASLYKKKIAKNMKYKW